jgi:two-component SAPR family response regulator
MGPDMGLNSLNQTIYFLRRTLEPSFTEELSPGYVRYQSDLVWLDLDLVDSDSARAGRIMASSSRPATPDQIDRLSEAYGGRFALDFAYEEWASDYRESLHASYLATIEDAVRHDVRVGDFGRGAVLARRALQIDPEAHQIERLLVRIYRLSGAHAAAAEQYAHYATSLQDDLGIQAPKLDEV